MLNPHSNVGPVDLTAVPVDLTARVANADKRYCICDELWSEDDDRPMVECSNKDCPFNGWFHFDCLNQPATWEPPETWFCRRCMAKK
jgi:hypothetical protein